ncbi:MAG: hypothetical protein K2W85_03465 [Phycisphaerales bacterium]|nr:hypothetical protein [Phycisphaerales bacterium]
MLVLGFPIGLIKTDNWVRNAPLSDPIIVRTVQDGTLILEDGTSVRPAGVRRAPGVPSAEYDSALAIMVAQGVIVHRVCDDGSAFLIAEPRFYNYCGTRRTLGLFSTRTAGWYFRYPLSELLVHSGFAEPDPFSITLSANDRWRIDGMHHIGKSRGRVRVVNTTLNALQVEPSDSNGRDIDLIVEACWKPPPA